jgi:hypothetical protein
MLTTTARIFNETVCTLATSTGESWEEDVYVDG